MFKVANVRQSRSVAMVHRVQDQYVEAGIRYPAAAMHRTIHLLKAFVATQRPYSSSLVSAASSATRWAEETIRFFVLPVIPQLPVAVRPVPLPDRIRRPGAGDENVARRHASLVHRGHFLTAAVGSFDPVAPAFTGAPPAYHRAAQSVIEG